MKAGQTTIMVIVCASLLTGCATRGHMPDRYAKRTGSGGQIGDRPKQAVGKAGHGLLATHFDRDGDGIFEESRRGETVSYDRNHDGRTDFVVAGSAPLSHLMWDTDFDGVLDRSITSAAGGRHEFLEPRRISTPGSLIFKQDHMQSFSTCELSEPGYRFWESLLQDSGHYAR